MNCLKRVFLPVHRLGFATSSIRYSRRTFLTTPSVQAREQDDVLSKFKNTSIFQKIADKPEALVALRDFAALMKEKGIDAVSGPPSTMQMLKLAASSDFRNAAQKVVTELKNAGVDLTSQDAIKELMELSKKSEGS